MKLAGEVTDVLAKAGIDDDICSYVFDKLVDGMLGEDEEVLINMRVLLNPANKDYVFIKDGKIASPKEVGTTIYRRV